MDYDRFVNLDRKSVRLLRKLSGLVVFIALFSFIVIQLIEFSHHHESQTLEKSCSICQFISHVPVNSELTKVDVLEKLQFLLYLLPNLKLILFIDLISESSYYSRAPPFPPIN